MDDRRWNSATGFMSSADKDHSGDLDKVEFGKLGDFAVADRDGDGSITDVEYYRYLIASAKQKMIEQTANEILAFVAGLNA